MQALQTMLGQLTLNLQIAELLRFVFLGRYLFLSSFAHLSRQIYTSISTIIETGRIIGRKIIDVLTSCELADVYWDALMDMFTSLCGN